MSVRRSLAKILMRCAAFLAPRDKTEWMHAMRAEFEATGDADALSWAAGCVGTTLLWRVRAEVIYVVALVAAVIAYEPCIIFVIENVIGEDHLDEYFMDMVHATEFLYLGLTTFLLGICWPRRLVLTAALVLLCAKIIPVCLSAWGKLYTGPDLGKQLWSMIDIGEALTQFFWWPVALGSLSAFVLNRLIRSRRRVRD